MIFKHTDLTQRSKLLLPDGRRADQLRLRPLLTEMRRLGLPVNATMTKQDALVLYENRVMAVVTDMRRHKKIPLGKDTPSGCREISPWVMENAARAIEQQADTLDHQPRPVQSPIATTSVRG